MLDKVKVTRRGIIIFPKNPEELEQFRIQYLGKKGKMNDLFAAFKEVQTTKEGFWSSFKSA